jgi:hypothetical protein
MPDNLFARELAAAAESLELILAADGSFTVARWPAIVELDLESLPKAHCKVDGVGIITIRAASGTAWYRIEDYDRDRPTQVVARRIPIPSSYFFERGR